MLDQLGKALVRARWVSNLALIASGCYVLASTGSGVLAFNLRAAPTDPTPDNRPKHRPVEVAETELTQIAERNLLAARRELPPPPSADSNPTESVAGDEFVEGDLRPCTLSLEVRATLVAGDPAWSAAVVYDRSKRKSDVVAVRDGDDELTGDAVLVDIRRQEIVVRRSDHFELCGVKDAGKNPPRRVSRARRAKTSASVGGVTKVGDNKWVVTREEVDNSLTNLSRVATQARIIPSFKNGKPNGFKLFSIKPNSIYKKIGLRNGDIVRKINGYEMNSPDKALEIYQKLKDATSVSIELQRRGQVKHFAYNIE